MIKKLIAALIVVAVVVSAAAAAWVYEQVTAAHAPTGAVEIIVPKGASSVKIARLLMQQKVITSDLVFRLLVRMRDAGGS